MASTSVSISRENERSADAEQRETAHEVALGGDRSESASGFEVCVETDPAVGSGPIADVDAEMLSHFIESL